MRNFPFWALRCTVSWWRCSCWTLGCGFFDRAFKFRLCRLSSGRAAPRGCALSPPLLQMVGAPHGPVEVCRVDVQDGCCPPRRAKALGGEQSLRRPLWRLTCHSRGRRRRRQQLPSQIRFEEQSWTKHLTDWDPKCSDSDSWHAAHEITNTDERLCSNCCLLAFKISEKSAPW